MSSEIHLAFAHPKERSEANETEPVYDRISLRDHIVEVEIGAFQSERGSKQRVCFNIVVEVKPLDHKIEDDVDRILSYDRVTEAITIELNVERLNLLETLAERIADRILIELIETPHLIGHIFPGIETESHRLLKSEFVSFQ